MAKKNPKNVERRAMVEKMRQEQARKERARSLAILGSCVLVVVVLLGVAGIKYVQDKRANDKLNSAKINTLGAKGAAATCDPIRTTRTDLSQNHIASGPIPYKDAPPAFGSHRPVAAPFGRAMYRSDRPEVANLVHNEEHGFTIAWYDDTFAQSASQMKLLETIATRYQKANQKFIAAPWHASDGKAFPDGKHLALTRWTADAAHRDDKKKQRGHWLYCGQVSGSKIVEFFNKYPEADAPENIPLS